MISLTPTTNCIICNVHKKRRKLKTVPSKIVCHLYVVEKVIIKCNSKMCASKCFKKFKFDDNNNIKITVKDLHKIDIYKPKIHSLSYKFHIQIINHIQKYKKQQRKNQQLINKQQKIINELSEKNFLTSKYSRIDISNIENYDYDAELESIPKSDKSNSWKNHIMYDLFSESDCQIHTGFDRKTIIKQARICQWHPELTFHLRHWIYAYQPRVLHANHFGWSAEKLTKWMFRKTLPIMHQRYAKKCWLVRIMLNIIHVRLFIKIVQILYIE
ncbi:MAG: hypothetical protein CMM87_05690 [Rickettsiales bacterium]|nr:hypothetical protein [Rickettsiales bacterium]